MEKNQKHIESGKTISRKQAIKKAGVTAFAASSFLLLNTNAQASASHCHSQAGGRQSDGKKYGGKKHGGKKSDGKKYGGKK